ncbi:SDR family oxidoreductase [Pseudomonas monteilii]|uniref:SDR family NAD(P)-dependent oxidoreductase n=1 Tax=Pseudomonas putida group TaxID=136845 RepID=UPI0018D97A37|nr:MULTISPECIES: SDR family oxidoreductase [Pseudomonas putida group]MBH3346681.1 SDR family oxidoreductase [Pseudomonas putida]MCE1020671.1 SDR family oxidoreductase [Pseudomonas monteilii]MCE1038200.1 SDR family oxidoreductase [Pseudomonas monteilii]MCE1089765.1 SDR family oxidoreductase [Pseudomonas monteilii]
MTQQFKGTALITGASTGIGSIYAERLARRGYDLVLVARNRERLNALASRITTETQQNVEVFPADLSTAADLMEVERKLREDASINLLVNNAGIGTHTGLLESDVERMAEMISLNITALTRLTYAAVPGFVARQQGAVINISSIAGLAPELLNGVYGGSKAYVTAFSQSLHKELADKGIKIQAVLPGATATDFWQIGGLPVENLDPGIVMSAHDLVDGALQDFDNEVLLSIPSLHDLDAFHHYEASRQALFSQLSSNQLAPRYSAK